MCYRIVLLAAIALAMTPIGKVRADLAPPLPAAKNSVAVTIEVDESAKGPKLLIPNLVFTQPRNRPIKPNPNAPKGELPQENGDGIAENATQPQNSLIYAGVALTLSLAFGGLWLIRKDGAGSKRALGLLLASGVTLAVGASVWADIPPLPRAKERPQPKAPVAYPSAFEGKADVSFYYGAEPVRLILDKESYEKLKKGELKMPQKPGTKPAPQ
jgi:hypothetical protein